MFVCLFVCVCVCVSVEIRGAEDQQELEREMAYRVLVTFDVDGTLMQSTGPQANLLHKKAFSHAFLQVFGVEGTIDAIKVCKSIPLTIWIADLWMVMHNKHPAFVDRILIVILSCASGVLGVHWRECLCILDYLDARRFWNGCS